MNCGAGPTLSHQVGVAIPGHVAEEPFTGKPPFSWPKVGREVENAAVIATVCRQAVKKIASMQTRLWRKTREGAGTWGNNFFSQMVDETVTGKDKSCKQMSSLIANAMQGGVAR